MPSKLIICGAPASGKGTQCQYLRDHFSIVHLSTGDVLRAAVAAGSDVGKKAKAYMDSGQLVPDEVIIGVVKSRLAEPDCVSRGWLLDGFPRTEAQARALQAAGIVPDAVVYLDVPDEVLVERVVGRRLDPVTGRIYHLTFSPPPSDEVAARLTHRSDDTEPKCRVRVENFHKHMGAVEACYTGLIVRVDGTQRKEAVFMALKQKLVPAGGGGTAKATAMDSSVARAEREAAEAAALVEACRRRLYRHQGSSMV